MAVAIPALIAAGSAVAGALANRSAAGNAQSAQERANQQARDWAEKAEEQRRLEWDRYQEQLRQQWEAYQTARAPWVNAALGVLQSHGTDITPYLNQPEFTPTPYTEGATVPESGAAGAVPMAPRGQPWGSMRWGDSTRGLFGSGAGPLQTGGGSLADIAAAQPGGATPAAPAGYGGFIDPMRDYFWGGDLGTLGGIPTQQAR